MMKIGEKKKKELFYFLFDIDDLEKKRLREIWNYYFIELNFSEINNLGVWFKWWKKGSKKVLMSWLEY